MKKFSKCMALLATFSLLSSLFFSCKQEPDVPVVTEISVDLKEKGKIFIEGDALSKDDVVVTALYSDGKTRDVTNRVKFSPELPLTLTAPSFTLVAEYDEKKAELKIVVGQKNDYYKNDAGEYIKLKEISLALKDSNKQFFEGDAISKDDFVVTAKYEDDTTKVVKESDGVTFEGITDEKLDVGKKTIKATFGSQSKSYEITVHKKDATVESISIALKSEKAFFVGDTISESDFTVTAKFSDGETENVTSKAEFEGLGATTAAGKVIITATYESKTGSCEVEVQAKTLTSISLALKSNKTYVVGDSISSSDFIVTAAYNNGTTEDVTSKAKFTGLEGATIKAGKVTITATYETKSANYDITVQVKTVTGISLALKSGKTFTVGDTISKDDFTVTAKYNNNTTEDVTNKAEFTGLVETTRAEKLTITATYEAKTSTIEITVHSKDATVESILLELNDPSKTYVVGDTISKSDFKVTAIYSDGIEEDVTNEAMINLENATAKPGKVTITATYQSILGTCDIVVNAKPGEEKKVVRIWLELAEQGRTFVVGETISESDFIVTAIYSDGFEEDVTRDSKFEGIGKMSKAGEVTITATYSSKTAFLTVQVVLPETLYIYDYDEIVEDWKWEAMQVAKEGSCFYYEFKRSATIEFCISTSRDRFGQIGGGVAIPQTGDYVELRNYNNDFTILFFITNPGDRLYVRYEKGIYYARYAEKDAEVELDEEINSVPNIIFDIGFYDVVGNIQSTYFPEYMLEDDSLSIEVIERSGSAHCNYEYQWCRDNPDLEVWEGAISNATSVDSPNFEKGYFYWCMVTATSTEASISDQQYMIVKESPRFYIDSKDFDVSLSANDITLDSTGMNLDVSISNCKYYDTIIWETSDPFVVSLDGYKTIYNSMSVSLCALENGTATITVSVFKRNEMKSASCIVTVNSMETEYSWWYSVLDTSKLSEAQTVNLIFNLGMSMGQTDDIEGVQSKGEIFYKWNGKGEQYNGAVYAKVDKSEVDESIIQKEVDTENKLVVYVSVPDEFSSVYLHAWDDKKNNYTGGSWPGVEMKKCK